MMWWVRKFTHPYFSPDRELHSRFWEANFNSTVSKIKLDTSQSKNNTVHLDSSVCNQNSLKTFLIIIYVKHQQASSDGQRTCKKKFLHFDFFFCQIKNAKWMLQMKKKMRKWFYVISFPFFRKTEMVSIKSFPFFLKNGNG